ncbi:MAG: Potassium channel beta chain, partial [uncultured Frankineae bacterium]
GVPAPGAQRHEGLGDQLRQLADARVAGRGRSGHRLRQGGARGRHHDLRHRRRLRRHARRDGPRRGAQGRAPRVDRAVHEGLLAHRARAERPRPVAQAHHGELPRLPAAAADRLRRPLPGAPLRLRDPPRGDAARLRRPGARRQGALHRGLGVEGQRDRGGAGDRRPDGPGPDRVVPAAVLHALAGDRGRGRAAVRARGHRPDRLVTDRAGRPDRQVPAGAGPARGLAGHRHDRRRQDDRPLAARRRAGEGAAAQAPRRRRRAQPGAAGRRLGAAEPQRVLGDRRRVTARAGARQRRCGRCAPGGRPDGARRRGAAGRRRDRPGPDREPRDAAL